MQNLSSADLHTSIHPSPRAFCACEKSYTCDEDMSARFLNAIH